MGLSRSALAAFTSTGASGRIPRLAPLARMTRELVAPLAIFDEGADPRVFERQGVRWILDGPLGDSQVQACRLAAHGVLLGESVEKIRERITRLRRAEGKPVPELEEAQIRTLAQSGLAQGLVVLLLDPEKLWRVEDEGLKESLKEALRSVAPRGACPTVWVVRNFAHRDFAAHDPSAPSLVARVSHQVVKSFLEKNGDLFTIAIGGGNHVATFVRSIGSWSTPFPDTFGNKRRYKLIPLTLETHTDHALCLADALIAELRARGNYYMDAQRMTASSFRNGEANRPIYTEMELAIHGVGDEGDPGWLRQLIEDLRLELDAQPITDVALNLLTEEGTQVPARDASGRLLNLGASLRDIGRLVNGKGKMALLLTSGPRKGRALAAVARAGYADHIVCDQAAARAAIAACEEEPSEE